MKTFAAEITLSDENYAAMKARASGMSDEAMVNSIVTGWCEPYAAADQQAALEELVPLGAKYLAAPDSVKLEVDAKLAPYEPAA